MLSKSIRQTIRFRFWRWLMYAAGQDVKDGLWMPAERKLLRAVRVAEELVTDANKADCRQEEMCLARSLGELSGAYRYRGNQAEADSLKKKSVDLMSKYAPVGGEPEIQALLAKSRILEKENKLKEALLLLVEARELAESTYGVESVRTVPILNALAGAYTTLQRFDEAEHLLRRALLLTENSSSPSELELAIALHSLAQHLRISKHFDESEQLSLRALAILEPDTRSIFDLAKDLASSRGDLKEIEKIQDSTRGLVHPIGVLILQGLALNYQRQGRADEAEVLFQKAINISENRKPHDVRELRGILDKYAKFLRQQGRESESIAVQSRANLL